MNKQAINSTIFIIMYFIIELRLPFANGHGRLVEPPARNTLWRYGFKAPANYNDNELFCGGIGGIRNNGGKCGICGDPFDGARIHETRGLMASNKTTRNYFPGSTIDVSIDIVANHGGTFNFEMCWRNSWSDIETEECFEPLKLMNHTNQTELEDKYELDPSSGANTFNMALELPKERTCSNCILRWHWVSANNWGTCEDGTEKVGCGLQEVYRNCADISVSRDGRGIGLGFLHSQ